MKRVAISPRPNWEQKITDQGFVFYNYESYYNESTAYEFTGAEIDAIETATAALYDMCMQVADHVVKHQLWDEFFIPREYGALITWSWKNRQPSFYGRFDLAFNNGQVKLLEFNADTPTSLLEASVIQWHWLQEHNSSYDQFNSIHEKLLAHIKVCKPLLHPGTLYFSCVDNVEDFMNVKYLQDVAAQAGFDTAFIGIDQIGLDTSDRFADTDGNLIKNIFKLYPYEWMFHEPSGNYLFPNKEQCMWIEPPYKAILSNKMLLKYLYELFPDSPYILPCTFLKPGETGAHPEHYVRKPVYSREGANITIVANGQLLEETGGDYGEEGFLYQQYSELPSFDGNSVVIGSWLIGGQPAGIGIRESSGLITNNTSRFCPHYIV